MSATRKTIQDMAERLISTLDSLMPSDQADAIVRDVAEELYNEVLGIKGNIVVDNSQPTGIVCGAFGGQKIAKYKFRASGSDV